MQSHDNSTPRICEHCQAIFTALAEKIRKGLARFCGRACANRYNAIHHPRKKIHDYGSGHKWCPRCKTVKTKEEFIPSAFDKSGEPCRNCGRLRQLPWVRANRDSLNASQRARRRKNPEGDRAKTRKWRSANRLKGNASSQKWKSANPDKNRLNENRRRAKKAQIPGLHTNAEWEELCVYFRDRCVKCGNHGKLTRDHVIPITVAGSSDWIANIQPLCGSCNSRKSNRIAIDYRPTPFQNSGQIVSLAAK